MTSKEWLLAALQFYNIEVVAVNENTITVAKNYEIEIEANGMYKLYEAGMVIAPFDDVDELCRFILI